MFKKFTTFLVAITFALLSQTTAARAEEYVFDAGHNNKVVNAQVIPNPETKQYLYGILGAGYDTVDYYSLAFSDYTPQVVFELLVPVRQTTNPFRPSLIVLDPASKQVIGGSLPFGFPTNMGGRMFPWPRTEERIVTDNDVWMKLRLGPQFIKDVSPSRYLVAVFDLEGRGGRYVLHLGAKRSADSFFSTISRLPALFRIKLDLY